MPRGRFDSKTTTIRPVGGLDSGTTYDLVVHTYTDPHTDNLNLVDSDLGSAVMATTASAGCAKPIIDVGWGDPMTLLVTGTWDSYLWSTAETTVSIDIASPPSQEWYWVTVASGSCVEAAVESPIFGDGFESGDTSGW
jgi:hypothetical protein